jgi:hypothetical protein
VLSKFYFGGHPYVKKKKYLFEIGKKTRKAKKKRITFF